MHTAAPVTISDVDLFASSQNSFRWQNSGLTVDNFICKLNSPAVELLLNLIIHSIICQFDIFESS
jgi:hypothetical protein